MKAIVHTAEWMVKPIMVEVGSYEIELDRDSDELLDQLQELVGGRIEIVTVNGNDLVVNEEGLLENLPINPYGERVGLHLVGTIVEIDGTLG